MSNLQEQIKEAKKAAKDAVKVQIKEQAMLAELKYISSPGYAQQLVVDAAIDRLDHVTAKVEDITNATAYAVFGYEQRIGKLIGLLKLIAYTANGKDKVRDKLKSFTRFDEVLLQKFIANAGKTAFYSAKFDEVVESLRPDVEQLKSVLSRAAAILGIVVDVELLTEEAVDGVYEYAENKADEAADGHTDMQQIAEKGVEYKD